MKSIEDLTTYLKTAMDLEATIFSLEESKKNAENKLESLTPQNDKPIKPSNESIQEPIYNPPVVHKVSERIGSLIIGLILLIVGLVLFFDPEIGYDPFIIGFAFNCLLVYFGFMLIIRPFSKHDEEVGALESYEKIYEALKEDYAQKMELYKRSMETYKIECEKAKKKYQRKLVIYRQAKDALLKLDMPINDAKRALDSLYRIDIIYPKYHNLVAISSFYEYFLSGRCTELTGPNGAYNLFESELRQNLIINRLENIVGQLEAIKANQYALYMELSEARMISQRVSEDVSNILSETRAQSQIEAVCMEATAKNTEAIKYISLLNSLKN